MKTKRESNNRYEAHRRRLIRGDFGIAAVSKLLEQLAIIDRRIREPLLATTEGRSLSRETASTLQLDTETFYTVAHDLFKLLELFLMEPARFRNEPANKKICRIRSQLVRHAFDKPDGNPYPGFGYSPVAGVMLKAGSQAALVDPGYCANHAAAMGLLRRYGVLSEEGGVSEAFQSRWRSIVEEATKSPSW